MMDSRVDISTFVQANNPGTYTPPVKSFTQVKRKAGFGWGPVINRGIPPFPPRVQPGIPPPTRDPRWDPASHQGSKGGIRNECTAIIMNKTKFNKINWFLCTVEK